MGKDAGQSSDRSWGIRHATLAAVLCTAVAGSMLGPLSNATRAARAAAGPTSGKHVIANAVPSAVVTGRARFVAHHASAAQLHLVLSLSVRNQGALDALIVAQNMPGNPQYHHYLTRAQYAAQYAPTAAQIAQVEVWAQDQGFAITRVLPTHLGIDVSATSAQAEAAFGVRINDYAIPGRTIYSEDRAPTLPAALPVQGVIGLNNDAQAQTALQMAGTHAPRRVAHVARATTGNSGVTSPGAHPASTNSIRNCGNEQHCYIPIDFKRAYNATNVSHAEGQYIGLVLWGAPVPQSDLDNFTSQVNKAGDSQPRLVVGQSGDDGIDYYSVDNNDASDTVDEGETAMDIEYAHGVAPGAHLVYYLGNTSQNSDGSYYGTEQGLYDSVTFAQQNSDLQIVSNSWSFREMDPNAQDTMAFNSVFQAAAAVGQTFYFATGDNAAVSGCTTSDCTAATAFPADSPYVAAVGGTNLTTNGDGTYNSESGWYTVSKGTGTGGGCSLEPQPSWQTGTGYNCTQTATNSSGAPGRLTPDIAADADPATGAYVVHNGGNAVIGGTSLATPLWAGFAADINYANNVMKGSLTGFTPPRIYQLANNATTYACDFHDVRSGSNGVFNAGDGWDPMTGWGSPNVDNLSNDYYGQSQCAQYPNGTPPNSPTSAPTKTATPPNTLTSTSTNTKTATPINTAVATPTGTASGANTAMATQTATNTPVPSATATPSNSPVSTATATPMSNPTATSTPTNSPPTTNTPTATSTPTNSPTAASTPTNTLTNTTVPTSMSTPTNAPTHTSTPTNTDTPTATSTPTNTPVLPAATNTSALPTATNTSALPTATSTIAPATSTTAPAAAPTSIPALSPIATSAPAPPTGPAGTAVPPSDATSTPAPQPQSRPTVVPCAAKVKVYVALDKRDVAPGKGTVRMRVDARPGTVATVNLTLAQTVIGRDKHGKRMVRLVTLYTTRATVTTATRTNRRVHAVKGQGIVAMTIAYAPSRDLQAALTVATRVECVQATHQYQVTLRHPQHHRR